MLGRSREMSSSAGRAPEEGVPAHGTAAAPARSQQRGAAAGGWTWSWEQVPGTERAEHGAPSRSRQGPSSRPSPATGDRATSLPGPLHAAPRRQKPNESDTAAISSTGPAAAGRALHRHRHHQRLKRRRGQTMHVRVPPPQGTRVLLSPPWKRGHCLAACHGPKATREH